MGRVHGQVRGLDQHRTSSTTDRTRGHRLTTLLTLAAVMAVVLAACDWSVFGYNGAHTRNNSTDTATSATNVRELVTAWRGATGAAISSSPAVAKGVVYVGSDDGNLYAFDATSTSGCYLYDCTPLWTALTGGPVSSSPSVVDGVVYVGSDDGNLYAFDANGGTGCTGTPVTCTPLWTARTGGPVRSSPLVANNIVYVGSDDGHLDAFDATGVQGCGGAPRTCAPLWTAATGGAVRSSPAIASNVVYVGSDDGLLYAFDATAGQGCSGTPIVCRPKWTAATGGPIESSPATSGGVVYVGSGDGSLYAFDANGAHGCAGTPLTCMAEWTALTGGPIKSSPAVANGEVYIGSDDGHLSAYDPSNPEACNGVPVACAPVWTAVTGGPVRSSPSVAGGLVYIGTADGHLSGYPTSGGADCTTPPRVCNPARTIPIGGAVASSPAIRGGIVYVGSDAGALVSARPVVTPLDPTLADDLLTPDRNDTFGLAVTGATTTASAPTSNLSGNTRIAFLRLADPVAENEQSCATWSGDSSTINQEGAALRVAETSGGPRRAITVTKNVYFHAGWIFNVHVWDTGTPSVGTQIGSFDLSSVFRPDGQQISLPWNICARAVGTIVSFIVWPASEAAPAWNDASHGGSVTLPAGWDYAGTAGWYIGHLQPGDSSVFTALTSGLVPDVPPATPLGVATGTSRKPSVTTSPRAPTAVHQLP